MTQQFAVIGNPIEHSRSPELHRAFAKKMGITLEYHKILAPLDGFNRTVQDFFAQGGRGLNITVPFKEQAFALCDRVSARAQIAKAVNTLMVHEGLLYGDNTDGQGLVAAIQAQHWSLKCARILILGAGGATRGVVYPLAQAGAHSITIANRTRSKAEQLVADLQQYVNCPLTAWGLSELQGKFDLIINATSASLSGQGLILPEELSFTYAYEMAYGKPSQFIEQAKQRHVPVQDGYSMLVGQAIEAFYLWHGVRPELKDFLELEQA